MREMSANCKTLLIAAFVIALDQLTKYLIVSNLSMHDVINCCGILNIVHVENKGVAFGTFGSLHEFVLFFISFSILVAYAVWSRKYQKSSSSWFSDALIAGGAVGNLIDRGMRRVVIDFLDFHYKSLHWPAFNVADSAVVLGVIVLVFFKRDEKK